MLSGTTKAKDIGFLGVFSFGFQQLVDKVNHVTGKEGAEAFMPNVNKALGSDEAVKGRRCGTEMHQTHRMIRMI